MYKVIIFLFLMLPIGLIGQSEPIVIGILPTEYAEGMPPVEFQEIEETIVSQLEAMPRYTVAKNQEDYYEVELGEDWFSQIEAIKREGRQSNVPYLVQIVFGDTEWTSKLEEVGTGKMVPKKKDEKTSKKESTSKDSTAVEEKPEMVEIMAKYWTQSATIRVTMNIYKVETGELAGTQAFAGNSLQDFKYSRLKATKRQDVKVALQKAKEILIGKTKRGLPMLFPLDMKMLDIVDESKKAITKVSVNGGSFHGLKDKSKLFLYYEYEHIINGKPVIREIFAATIIVEEAREKTSICKVKRGGKKLKALLAEGKKIKCGIKNFISWVDGYGF